MSKLYWHEVALAKTSEEIGGLRSKLRGSFAANAREIRGLQEAQGSERQKGEIDELKLSLAASKAEAREAAELLLETSRRQRAFQAARKAVAEYQRVMKNLMVSSDPKTARDVMAFGNKARARAMMSFDAWLPLPEQEKVPEARSRLEETLDEMAEFYTAKWQMYKAASALQTVALTERVKVLEARLRQKGSSCVIL